MSKPEKIRIAIIGGGIVGLTLAAGLLKHEHLDVMIYEASSCFSEIGAGLTVGPNAKQALELLNPKLSTILEEMTTGNLSPGRENCYMIYHVGVGEKAGEFISAPEMAGGHQSVHRARFLEEVANLLPPEHSQFNKRLVEIEEKDRLAPITLHFDDGTTALADAVLGADGIHSFVREYLLGGGHPAARPVFTGAVAYRQIVPMDEAIAKLGVDFAQNATYFMGPDKGMFSYPLDHGESINMISLDYYQDSWDHEEWKVPASREELEKVYQGWGPQAKASIDLLTSKPLWKWGMHDHLPAPFYNNGRIVMLGDAAHASTPYQGQGAAQGIEDAETLDALLAQTRFVDHLAYAFSAFDQVRRPRAEKVVRTSRETGYLLAQKMEGVGEDLNEITQEMHRRYHWLWNRDIRAQNRAAVELFHEALPRRPLN